MDRNGPSRHARRHKTLGLPSDPRYPGRTPHIHVKIEPPGGPVLTTQLYMPNEASNSGDSIFRPELALTIQQGTPLTGIFAFILDRS